MKADVTLGRYKLLEELGVGGMAVVHRAEDPVLRREVAIKVLHPHLLRKPDHRARFLREARAAAALDHPGILRVLDVGGADGEGPAFIVMELLRGKSLKQFLEENGAPLAEVAAMMGSTLAEALSVAHKAGVIHRDVKPANVMIDAGRLVLCDFGVARVTDDDAVVTQSGAMLGTPAFMSPEQAVGRPADVRSDVYSAGATIYQIATGHLPATGSTPVVLAAVSRGDYKPPLQHNPTIGPDLAKVIQKAMDMDPAKRYATAGQLREALDEVARAAGFTDAGAELGAYFAAPGAWNEQATGKIISATLARAKTALAARQVARSLALADRVLAFRPDHQEAQALVASVGEGSRRWRRAKMAAIGIMVAALLAVGGAAWIKFRGPAAPPTAALSPDAAPVAPIGPMAPLAAADAALAAAAVPDAGHLATAPRPDAAARRVAAHPDAAPVTPVANPVPAPDAGAPPAAQAHLQLDMRGWCDVTIDGTSHGRARKGALIDLPAGRHQVICAQTGSDRSYRASVDLSAGETRVLTGGPLAPVDVTLAIDARIDRARHAEGATVRLPPGTYFIEALSGDKVTARAYVNVPTTDCTLKAAPELACY